MKQLVVFDFDGTLANSLPIFFQTALEFSRQNNLPDPCLESLKTGYGNPDLHDFGWGVCKDTQRGYLHRIYDLADDLAGEEGLNRIPSLFDGVFETLHQLEEAGHELAIVTAKSFEPLQIILEHHDIHARFRSIRSHDDISRRGERGKPHPDQLISVIRELEFTPERTVMVGDTTMDMVMGKGAGAFSVGVTWGCHHEELLRQAGADMVVTGHFTDLLPMVVTR